MNGDRRHHDSNPLRVLYGTLFNGDPSVFSLVLKKKKKLLLIHFSEGNTGYYINFLRVS